MFLVGNTEDNLSKVNELWGPNKNIYKISMFLLSYVLQKSNITDDQLAEMTN